ncbi:antibiotic biosynthesis monooxygenase [Mycobacterium sp. MS1601]|uniref:putative quinol monooxygenase n=1 Tax=Mycobacterium sp. MS1601 TaxID=1936029 RepID=UPI0009795625|nr:antibiotic biosynthesis monooxygenase family protein [Mycobacterium sp. MS1601]AQA05542.1 antibiotic biosynthesis monooxygenase [Mycobacterium sp. MS1601]
MVIVAGHLTVAAHQRKEYLQGCSAVVQQARATPGCLDFSISADLVDPGRINIFERWETTQAVEEFRGGGPGDDQGAAILAAAVAEYNVSATRSLS